MSRGDTSIEQVTFRRPFMLPGFDTPHRPGTFDVRTEREALDVWWPAYRLTLTILLAQGAVVESFEVTRGDLDAALLQDAEEIVP